MIRKLLFTLVAIGTIQVLSGCLKTVTMSAMRPAEISFPSHINKVLLVNRTQFDQKGWNILEGILTGEMPGEDKSAAEAALSAFQTTLISSPRFDIARYPQTLLGNSLTAAFPAPLSWDQLQKIASESNSDAVVSVEIFDTDFIVTRGNKKVKKTVETDGVKRVIEVTQFTAEGIGNVKIGFRVYDLKSKSIIDEQLFNQSNNWSSSGDTPEAAIRTLISKTEAARYVSQRAANSYAYKIAPMPVRISREFYTKAKRIDIMNSAARRADVNDWEGAISMWKDAMEYASEKSAGKLGYNIAVGYEVLGELDLAKKWAQDSYVNFGNRKAQAYVNIINRRIRDEERVMDQMQ